MTTPFDDLAVAREISQSDEMFTGDRIHYFQVGQSALDCVRGALDAAQLPARNVGNILDLPCGHGRVLRYLRAYFGDAKIVASDVNRDAVDFCARRLGACPAYASEDPATSVLEREGFDLIWVGSLFTHLDAPRWNPLLSLFQRSLRPGGVLVFTTHGSTSHDWMARGVVDYGLPPRESATIRFGYEHGGFGYADYSNLRPYGHSLSSQAWVTSRVSALDDLRLVHFAEAAWDRHQDVYACVRGRVRKSTSPACVV